LRGLQFNDRLRDPFPHCHPPEQPTRGRLIRPGAGSTKQVRFAFPLLLKCLVQDVACALTLARMRLSDISSYHLERVAHVATILGVPLVFLTVLFGYFQVLDGNRAARLTNFITLTTRFFNPTNTEIIDAVENWRPILPPKGKFTEAQLDNYLADFDTIDEAYDEGFLSEPQLCMLSYYITLTATNKEISNYIAKVRRLQRAEATPWFVGYYRLVELVQNSRLPDCR
jgi:hypothetical protein